VDCQLLHGAGSSGKGIFVEADETVTFMYAVFAMNIPPSRRLFQAICAFKLGMGHAQKRAL
jgi:hypothetical protein